jgi:prepilin-type N-terminal cleavage/methylation domain-containing protein
MGDKKQQAVFAKIRSHTQGFTLLEVIIAVSILAIGLLALASLQLTTIRGKAFAGGGTDGKAWATNRMVKLLALPHTDALLSAGSHTDPAPPDGYAVTWHVSDNDPIKNTKTIRLTVSCTNHGKKKSAVLSRVMLHLSGKRGKRSDQCGILPSGDIGNARGFAHEEEPAKRVHAH